MSPTTVARSGAGVGVGMLRGGGGSTVLVSWCLASWFQSFLVSEYLGFKIDRLLGFLFSKFSDPILLKNHFMFSVIY